MLACGARLTPSVPRARAAFVRPHLRRLPHARSACRRVSGRRELPVRLRLASRRCRQPWPRTSLVCRRVRLRLARRCALRHVRKGAELLCTTRRAATINKLLAEALPADLKLSAEVRDMFADCCTGALRARVARLPRRAHALARLCPPPLRHRVCQPAVVGGERAVRKGQEENRRPGARAGSDGGAAARAPVQPRRAESSVARLRRWALRRTRRR